MQNIRSLHHANVSSGDSSLHLLNFRWTFSHNIRSRYCASMVTSSQAWSFARTYCGPSPCPGSNFKLHVSCLSSSTSGFFPPHSHQIILTLLDVHYSENQFTLRLLGWSTVEFPASYRSVSATAASLLRLVILGTWLAGDKSSIMVFFCLLYHVRSFPTVVGTQFFSVALPQSDDQTQPPSTSYSPCHAHKFPHEKPTTSCPIVDENNWSTARRSSTQNFQTDKDHICRCGKSVVTMMLETGNPPLHSRLSLPDTATQTSQNCFAGIETKFHTTTNCPLPNSATESATTKSPIAYSLVFRLL